MSERSSGPGIDVSLCTSFIILRTQAIYLKLLPNWYRCNYVLRGIYMLVKNILNNHVQFQKMSLLPQGKVFFPRAPPLLTPIPPVRKSQSFMNFFKIFLVIQKPHPWGNPNPCGVSMDYFLGLHSNIPVIIIIIIIIIIFIQGAFSH